MASASHSPLLLRTGFISLIFQLCFAFLMTTGSALAEERVLRVAFHEHPPWKVVDEEKGYTGIDIEFLRLVAEQLDLKLEFVPLPFKRGLKMVELGEVDLMTGVLKRPEREAVMHFIEPAYKNGSTKAFFMLKGREHLVRKHEDLKSLRIGTGLGVKYYPEFDNDQDIHKHAVSSADLNIRMLLAGHVDAFIMTESTGDYRIALLGLSDRIAKAPHGYHKLQGVHMVLSKHALHAPRLEEFNRVVAQLVADGAMDRLTPEFYTSLRERASVK